MLHHVTQYVLILFVSENW